jgi:hypothetical protein
VPENRIKQRLYQMSKDGEVEVVSRGRYEPHNHEAAKVTEVMDSRNEGGEASLVARTATCPTRTIRIVRGTGEARNASPANPPAPDIHLTPMMEVLVGPARGSKA